MSELPYSEFSEVYREVVADMWPHWNTEMQTEIARHCHGWRPGASDFKLYLEASVVRFYQAYQALRPSAEQTVCDVGGFWGVWALTLRALGHDVSMTETLRYYAGSFDPLFDHIREKGVVVYDLDPFDKDVELPRTFDLVSVMAVIEHYPHSLRTFMHNIKSLVTAGGRVYLEVPNIAYLPRRIGLLAGRTPLAEMGDIYHSEVPFIGHHHEFTIAELRQLARLSGFAVLEEYFLNYTPGTAGGLRSVLRMAAKLPFWLFKETREVISILCTPDGDQRIAAALQGESNNG